MTTQRERTLQQFNEREPLTGNLIDSLIDIVEKSQPTFDADDDIEIERVTKLTTEPLTIDEVLGRLDLYNPYESLVRSVGRWM